MLSLPIRPERLLNSIIDDYIHDFSSSIGIGSNTILILSLTNC